MGRIQYNPSDLNFFTDCKMFGSIDGVGPFPMITFLQSLPAKLIVNWSKEMFTSTNRLIERK